MAQNLFRDPHNLTKEKKHCILKFNKDAVVLVLVSRWDAWG